MPRTPLISYVTLYPPFFSEITQDLNPDYGLEPKHQTDCATHARLGLIDY